MLMSFLSIRVLENRMGPATTNKDQNNRGNQLTLVNIFVFPRLRDFIAKFVPRFEEDTKRVLPGSEYKFTEKRS